jgi:hypothetical protein
MKIFLFIASLLLLSMHSLVVGDSANSPNSNDRHELSQLIDFLLYKKNSEQLTLPSKRVLELSLAGYEKLVQDQLVRKPSIITIIDFSLPSDRERMWVIDINKGKVLFHCLVAHGRNSGELYAEKFSNVPGSYTSSPGFYLTDAIYTGKHGMSLYLDGLEKGINDKARERTIVIHSADYVCNGFVEKHGRLGRSHGCPAIPVGLHKDIIRTIQGGSCLYIHAPEELYVMHSPILGSLNL